MDETHQLVVRLVHRIWLAAVITDWSQPGCEVEAQAEPG